MKIGGLDIGTTGCKLTVYQENGEHISTVYRAYDEMESFKTQNVEPGMMDGQVFLDAVREVIEETTKATEVDAIGVTSFGETFVMLDDDDNVIFPSIMYVDSRGVEECKVFDGKETEKITGVEPGYLFSLCKIMWIKNHHPEIYDKAKRILLMQDFIVYSLSGVAQIDYSLACRTMGLDIRNKCWSDTMFDLAGVDKNKMSKPVPAGTVAGKSNKFGLKDTIIVSGAIDQVAAMTGAGVFDAAVAMDGIGTVECVCSVMDEIPRNEEYYKGGYAITPYGEGRYVSYILSFAGGASIKWYRDQIARGVSYGELNDSVDTENPTGLLVLPHFRGAATPYMDDASKAAILGITADTTREELYQAVLEGISYEMLYNIETAEKNQKKITKLVATGGGAKSKELLQIKANIYNRPVVSLQADEVGAVGTMMLTAVAIGAYENLEEARKVLVSEKETFYPNSDAHARYMEVYEKYKRVYNAVRPVID